MLCFRDCRAEFSANLDSNDMEHKKDKKEPGNATRHSVKKEMAKPRLAKAARC